MVKVRKMRKMLSTALILSLLSPVKALSDAKTNCTLTTYAQLGGTQAFYDYLRTIPCGTVSTFDPNLGYLEEDFQTAAREQDNPGLNRYQLCFRGDETLLTAEQKTAFENAGVHFIELRNMPSIEAAYSAMRDSIGKYTSGIVGVQEEGKNSFSVRNPFQGALPIAYSLEKPGEVTIEIYDVAGRKLDTVKQGYELPGNHFVSWNCSSYNSSVYLVRFKAGSETTVRKAAKLN